MAGGFRGGELVPGARALSLVAGGEGLPSGMARESGPLRPFPLRVRVCRIGCVIGTESVHLVWVGGSKRRE